MRTGGALHGAVAQSLLVQAPQRELAPGEMIGAFRIVREHSRGGMAIIYLAERADGEFNQRVALKWMQQDSQDQFATRLFEREREFVASLEHPNIAHLLDGGREPDGAMWFAMEWIEGVPIDCYCRTHQCDQFKRLQFIMTLCDAIGSAHAKLLLHRDIKPANVLVTEQGHIKLLDFGIAQMLGQDDPGIARALTLAFASPEQIAGETLGISSDVYQLGVLMCVLLDLAPELSTRTDTLAQAPDPDPQFAQRPVGTLVRHSQNWPKLAKDLRAIIGKAIERQPEQRYPSADALKADLVRYLAKLPVSALADRWHYRLACFWRRHRVSISLAALASLALLALSWRVWVERNAAKREAELARMEAARARASIDFISELLNWSKPSEHKGRAISVDEALQYATLQLQSKLKDQPRTRGELLLLFADIYDGRKEFARGLVLAEEAHQLIFADRNADQATRAHAAVRLASLLSDQPMRKRSIAMAKQALSELEAIDQSHTDRQARQAQARLAVAAHRIWAMRLLQNEQSELAEQRARSGLQHAKVNLDPLDQQLLQIEALLASVLKLRGEFAESLAIRRSLLPRLEQSMGVDHPQTQTARLNLMHDLAQFGEYQAAEALAELHFASVKRVWGDQHPDYARALYERGFIALEQNQFDKARADLKRSIEISLAAGADGELQLSATYERLAITEEVAGNLAAAEAALRQALSPKLVAIARTPSLGSSQLKLARVLILQKRFDEVPTILQRARAEMKSLSVKHARWAILHELTADLAMHEKNLERAKANYQAAIDQLQHAQTNSRDFDLKRNQQKLTAISK